MAPERAPAGATLGTGPAVHRGQNASFTFDALGNLIGRGDAPNGQASETYGYDLLNRLTTRNGVNIASYHADGRLNTRGGVSGIYGYQTGTHRVNSAGGYSLGYDANGNVTTLSGNGSNKTLTYLPFNLPSRIAAEGNILDYRYDAAHARIKETVQIGTAISSTYYLGAFEEHTRNDGVVELRHYLTTPEGAVGIVTRRSNAQNDTRYWFKDHLGSIVAITGGAGVVKQRLTYDPWGKRTTAYIADANAEERGYTGHEHLIEAGLIHMNGRLYFDALGRMLQADPIIQAPYDGQNYDRYAYVFNNPLSFIDPTGYSAWTRIRAPVAAIIVMIATYGAASAAWGAAVQGAAAAGTVEAFAGTMLMTTNGALTATGAMVIGAAGGFAAGGLSSGNIEGALQGALQGAAFGALNFGIGHITTGAGNVFGEYAKAANVALHAVVGCAQSAAAGGSCKGGAASGGFSAAAGAVGLGGGVVGRAVVGAMASKLAGGRAGDGAMVAAFDYLFNHLVHVGVSGRIPIVGGGKASFGISWQDGKFDAGLIFEGDIPSANAGKMLGKVAAEAGYQPGDFDSARGSLNVQVQGHYKMVGGSYSYDAENSEFSGASVSVGPGLGISVSGTRTNTISVRQLYREVIRPAWDWLEERFGQ